MNKKEIIELKESGFSYKEVSELTGVKENTIKTVVRRARLALIPKDRCKCCGKILHHVKNKKKKMFCSMKCRMRYYRYHPECINRKAQLTKICPVCGKEYLVYPSKNSKFCSLECYHKQMIKH